jgi:hypothetical protein
MAFSDFSAKRATKRQSLIDVSSGALPKLPVSSSLVAVVPRTIIRSPRLQPGKFVTDETKGLLQHYLPQAAMPNHVMEQTFRPAGTMSFGDEQPTGCGFAGGRAALKQLGNVGWQSGERRR